ncbi:protein of unknown function [Chryseolinea serpens]|uniref:eCIS core domain-containing protein n=1 Tax=Chryseolinea serpens TaxID=947013 RepID=A0A1M5UNW4_9BACT|nr:DUF4157 domain-containing protein [Chryseolinea serpens]SHH64631.1 protein of unknown function [Chryseolinea serpens]
MKTLSTTSSSTQDSRRHHFFHRQTLRTNVPFFQPKLSIGPVDDVYEREADAVANAVVNNAQATGLGHAISPLVQAKCAHCEEEEKLQRKDTGRSSQEHTAPSIVDDALRTGGHTLEGAVRGSMEKRFGYDFGQVKIHTGTVAAKSAAAINALAYTSGNHIVFNTGQFNPSSASGQRLLAHELTHVVQQGAATSTAVQREEADTTGPTGGDRQADPKEGDCKGQESDPQSFCIKVAEHFMVTEFNTLPAVSSIEVSDDGGCRVHYVDGSAITVQKLGNQKVFVQVSPSSTNHLPSRVRCYTYTCELLGKMNFTTVSCKA